MASSRQIKTYLAHWFQLGKKLVWNNGEAKLLPEQAVEGDRFTNEFEECWRKIMSISGRDCYLEGTTVSIAELLDSSWTVDRCARCSMPVPIVELGIQDLNCPCSDLDNWPNLELPAPRGPIDSLDQLRNINMRLKNIGVAPQKDSKR